MLSLGVKERGPRPPVCLQGTLRVLAGSGRRHREKDRGWLPAAKATASTTTLLVVEDEFTLAASSKCSGTRGVPYFRFSGQTKGACAPTDRRRLGEEGERVRRDRGLTQTNSATSPVAANAQTTSAIVTQPNCSQEDSLSVKEISMSPNISLRFLSQDSRSRFAI